MSPNSSPVAAAVRAELARAGISGRQLARDLGWSPAFAERRLAGTTPLRVDDLIEIAGYLAIPIERFTEHVASTPPRGMPAVTPRAAS